MNKKMINKALCGIGVAVMLASTASAVEISGEAFNSLTNDAEVNTFANSRTVVGLDADVADNVTARVALEGANADGGVTLRNAYIDVDGVIPNATARIGVQTNELIEAQDKAFAYRYVAVNSAEGYSAWNRIVENDEGVLFSMDVNDMVSVSLGSVNGQDNDNLKYCLHADINATDELSVFAYFDTEEEATEETTTNLALVAAYDAMGIADVSFDYSNTTNNSVSGFEFDFSIMGLGVSYPVNDKFTVFGKFSSVTGDDIDDTTNILAGVEHQLAENVKVAIAINQSSVDGGDDDKSAAFSSSFTF